MQVILQTSSFLGKRSKKLNAILHKIVKDSHIKFIA